MTIGQTLKQQRLARGETLEAVAFRAGTDASNLSRIERGQQQPSAALLEALARALGLKVADIYDTEPAKTGKVADSQKARYDNELVRLQRHFRELDPASRKLVIDFVKLLKKQKSGR